MKFVVGAILDRGHATHHVAILQREKELSIRMFIKGILAAEDVLDGDTERRHPGGVRALIQDAPRHVDERVDVA